MCTSCKEEKYLDQMSCWRINCVISLSSLARCLMKLSNLVEGSLSEHLATRVGCYDS